MFSRLISHSMSLERVTIKAKKVTGICIIIHSITYQRLAKNLTMGTLAVVMGCTREYRAIQIAKKVQN